MEAIKLSLVTTTFNCKSKLPSTLDSVTCNTNFDLIEHIFIDSLSNDGTIKVIENYCSQAKYRTKLISEKDEGIYDGLNKATYESRGEFILVLHAGDLLTMNISDILNDLDIYQNSDFISYSGSFYDGNNEQFWSRKDYPLSIYNPALRHPCILIKRAILNYYNGYDTSFKISADYHLISKYFLDKKMKKKIAVVDKNLLRMESFGFSDTSKNFLTKKKEHLKIIKPANFNFNKLKFYYRLLKHVFSFIINRKKN